MCSVAGCSVAGSPTYSRTTIDEASSGIGTHCAAPRTAGGGSTAENTNANDPESSARSVSLT